MVLENKIFIQVIKKLHSDRLNFNALIKIIEERLADRYAAFVYNKLNNEIVRYYMQNIYTDTEVLNYKNRFEQSLKMGDEDLYTHIKKIESFILP